jgi:protein-disulfide isomerase
LIRQRDLGIEALLKELRRRVARETGNQQVPWDHSSLFDDFYFVPGSQKAASEPSLSATPVGCPPGQIWRDGACVEAPRLGRIVVRSNVTRDLVKIDGQPLGPSGPGGWEVLPGQHVVSVHKAGYVTVERTVTVAAGEKETLVFALSPPDTARIATASQTSERESAARSVRPDPDRKYHVPIGDSPVRGKAAAPVTIVEFRCFAGTRFGREAASTLERIQRTYGDEVKIVFKHLVTARHRFLPAAHAAAEAAKRQGRFWEMHDLIYANGLPNTEEKYVEYARQIGLDVARFNRDRKSHAVQARIDADRALASKLGVRGTPAFFVNGRALTGAQPFETFKSKIDAELRTAPRRGRPDPDRAYDRSVIGAVHKPELVPTRIWVDQSTCRLWVGWENRGGPAPEKRFTERYVLEGKFLHGQTMMTSHSFDSGNRYPIRSPHKTSHAVTDRHGIVIVGETHVAFTIDGTDAHVEANDANNTMHGYVTCNKGSR